jgi:L-alanine-DL-glutamate epimerase-like enolase superfamily enzyme
MNRRHFLSTIAVAAARPAAARITQITLAPIDGRFHKFVAMNSYDKAPKGHTYTNTLIRVATDVGVEGVGELLGNPRDAALQQALRTLLGADPLRLYEMRGGSITGRAPEYAGVLSRYRSLDGPLFDLVGKLTGQPAWRLIGGSARDRVEAYDGTLYFSDVWFRDRAVRAVVEEAEEAVKRGYLAGVS